MKSEPMDLARKYAEITSSSNLGGPFGATIVETSTGKVICTESNKVLEDKDPTAHAEVTAIRKACKILDTYDLRGYTIYATGYPCPMCMSAIIWANLDKLIFACPSEDAADIGFRDDFIYDFIRSDCDNESVLKIEWDKGNHLICKNLLYNKYKNTIY